MRRLSTASDSGGGSNLWLPYFAPVLVLNLVGCEDRPAHEGAESEESGGSDESGESGELVRICDGSDNLRLAARVEVGGLVESELLYEVGFTYLYVNGHCEFWVRSDTGEYDVVASDTHHGTIATVAEEEIRDALHYSDWADLAGTYAASGYDLPTNVFSDFHDRISCYGSCAEAMGAVPDDVKQLDENARTLSEDLYATADPWLGGMRVTVFALPGVGDDVDACSIDWPFSWSPETIARPIDEFQDQVGLGFLVDDMEDATMLRDLRAQYRGGGGPSGACAGQWNGTWVLFRLGTAHYSLYMRDALPFEDATGLIAL